MTQGPNVNDMCGKLADVSSFTMLTSASHLNMFCEISIHFTVLYTIIGLLFVYPCYTVTLFTIFL